MTSVVHSDVRCFIEYLVALENGDGMTIFAYKGITIEVLQIDCSYHEIIVTVA